MGNPGGRKKWAGSEKRKEKREKRVGGGNVLRSPFTVFPLSPSPIPLSTPNFVRGILRFGTVVYCSCRI